jgi:hypothetical protein
MDLCPIAFEAWRNVRSMMTDAMRALSASAASERFAQSLEAKCNGCFVFDRRVATAFRAH